MSESHSPAGDQPTSPQPSINGSTAVLLVAATSGLVLVLEILAGRLLAPYIGVSLDTFTGIIGTILAGIAVGAAVGGNLADKQDPVKLIGRALFIGGGLTWLSIPITTAIGPSLGNGPVAIVLLTAASFLLPTAVLSGIGPMVTKLQLGTIEETGAVVGKLSAASTFGALLGTFGTGFILISLLPVRTIIIAIGALLVIAGIVVSLVTKRALPDITEMVMVIFAAVSALTITGPCDQTTDYYCIRIVADDPDQADSRDNGVSLWLDGLRHAHVDLDDPEYLDIRYMRLFADAVGAMPDGPIRVLHVGGGGFSLPRYINEVRPGSTNVVLELDDALVDVARDDLGLTDADNLDIRTGDARLHLAELDTDSFDLIVGDAYGGAAVPWHLTTTEVMGELERLLTGDGLYIMNVIDGNESRFARSQLLTIADHFENLAVIEPADGIPGFAVNQVFIVSNADLPEVNIDPEDGRLFDGDAVSDYIGEDVQILTDNYAPTDQLLA